jgi:hypothetical protein
MTYRTMKLRSSRAEVARRESSGRRGQAPPSAALLISLLAVAICLAPFTPASAASPGGGHQIVAVQPHATNVPQMRAANLPLALAASLGAEGNPIRFPRPRVMAIIGIGLLAVGVFLRRREGNGI